MCLFSCIIVPATKYASGKKSRVQIHNSMTDFQLSMGKQLERKATLRTVQLFDHILKNYVDLYVTCSGIKKFSNQLNRFTMYIHGSISFLIEITYKSYVQ